MLLVEEEAGKFMCCYERQFRPNIRFVMANFPVYYSIMAENLCHSKYGNYEPPCNVYPSAAGAAATLNCVLQMGKEGKSTFDPASSCVAIRAI